MPERPTGMRTRIMNAIKFIIDPKQHHPLDPQKHNFAFPIPNLINPRYTYKPAHSTAPYSFSRNINMTQFNNNTSDSPTLAEIQQTVHLWISQWKEGYFPPLANLARMTEEVGELARAINHHHGHKPKKDSEPDLDIAEELADILFLVATIANSLDIDLTEAFAATMHKLQTRDKDRFTKK